MIRSGMLAILAGSAALVVYQAPSVDAHIYLMDPISRPYWYSPVFQERPFFEMEHCPHCMNSMGTAAVRARAISLTDKSVLDMYGGETGYPLYVAAQRGEVAENGNYLEPEAISVRHGVCGDPKQRTEESWNQYSTPNSEWPILETYKKNSVLEIKVAMAAHHYGHLEFFLCNAEDLEDPNGVVTQECLNMNPLWRAENDDANSPVDPNYPGRYYVDPVCRAEETDQTKPDGAANGNVMHMRYQLPSELECKRCILQMVYYTGNVCKHIGYDDFEPASWPSECAPDKEDWITTNRITCGEEERYPEEFWNCADIAITADGEPNPTPAPTEPIPDCADPVGEYGQCGGTDYTGSDCCIDGYECTSHGSCYSDCRIIPGACGEKNEQCGGVSNGEYWTGTTCCWPGLSCVEKSAFRSTCVAD